MSDQQKIPVELPKFKDKVMYISSAISDTRLETSYVISSSFKGIVRLSPNNHTIVNENATHQLSVQDENSQGLIYSDAIVFDNDVQNAMKSVCDITQRMIIASESSGFLVNFRLSDKDLEIDNLGVIGITQSNSMAIYTSSTNTINPNTFYIGSKRMPSLANNSGKSTEVLYKDSDFESKKQEERTVYGLGNYDVRQVKVKDDADKSYLLTTLNGSFRFKNTKSFISDLIIEALLSLQTIPTGSVHFVPVTLQQYQALTHFEDSKFQIPNKNFTNNSSKGTPTDPLIRDFLLCDGREYNNADFPELAKILWGQKIHTWKQADNSQQYYYPVSYQNDYKESKKFRVPDLRHLFIGCVHAKGQENMNTSKIPDASIRSNSQDTGSYFPDNLPKYSRHYKKDNHRHFIASGTYDANLYSSNQSFHTNMISNYIVKNGDGTLKLDVDPIGDDNYAGKSQVSSNSREMVGTMYLANHPFNMGDKHFNGFGVRTTDIPQKNHLGVDSFPAHFFASIPMISRGKPKSQNLGAYTIGTPESINSDFIGKTSDCILSVYNGEKNDTLHGHENSPKFFAMLPLIKI